MYKIKNKIVKTLVSGSLVLSIAELSTKLVGFLLLPVFTYYLSPGDYGTVSYALLLVTILNLIYNPGILSATTRVYHSYNNDDSRKEIIGTAHLFFIIVPVLTTLILLFIGEKITKIFFSNFEFYPYGLIAVFIAMLSQSKRIWVSFMALQYNVKPTALWSFFAITLGIITSLVLVIIFEMKAAGRLLGILPQSIVLFVISYIYISKYTNNKFSFQRLKELLKLGSPLVIAILSYELLHMGDRYLVGEIMGMSALGIYTLAYQLGEAQNFLFIGLRQLWTPIVYENLNKNNNAEISKVINMLIIFITIINISIILLLNEFILLFINEKFYNVIEIAPIVVSGLYFNGLLIISNTFLSYNKRFKHISYIACFATLFNIVANIILIPKIGLYGAAITTLFSYIIYFVLSCKIQWSEIKFFINIKIIILASLLVFISLIINIKLTNEHVIASHIGLKCVYIIIAFVTLFIYNRNFTEA